LGVVTADGASAFTSEFPDIVRAKATIITMIWYIVFFIKSPQEIETAQREAVLQEI
jgi:hypothetical protein